MFEDLIGSYGARFLIAALGVGIALACFALAMVVIRRRAPSPFIRGGKNRQPRLQVLDAAAVDARRRLVLVRRDDVEHLIMIGGPTDIVIESGIGGAAAQETPLAQPQPAPRDTVERIPERRAEIRPAAERAAQPAEAAPAPPAPARQPADRRTYVEPAATQPRVAAAPAPQPVAPAVQPRASTGPVGHGAAPPPVPQPAVTPSRVATPAPVAQDAADALDAARERVLPQQVARPAVTPTPAATAPVPAQRELGSEFDRILEAEMENNLSAERIEPSGEPPAPAPAGARDPSRPVITGAGPSQDQVQKEMARIFGEMSVTRDK